MAIAVVGFAVTRPTKECTNWLGDKDLECAANAARGRILGIQTGSASGPSIEEQREMDEIMALDNNE